MTEKKFVFKSTLKSMYGLTDSMIKELGEPDKRVPNPYYKSGPPSSLYAIERVETWVDANRERLVKAASQRAKRSSAAMAAADRKRQAAIEWAQGVQIESGNLPSRLSDLVRLAKVAFENFRAMERHDYNSELTITENAIVAHVRHNWTNYESLLVMLEGMVEHAEAYLVIHDRCNEIVQSLLVQSYGDDWPSRLGGEQ